MNARSFNAHFGRVSAFDIYTAEKYKDFVLLIAACPLASEMVHWASKIIAETVLSFSSKPVNINISVYDATSKDKTNTFTCVHTIIAADAAELMTYLRGLNLMPPVDKKALNTAGLSVGPCAYRNSAGIKYVKVRMPGYSIPFVLDKAGIEWDPTATKQALLKNKIGGFVLDQLFKVLEDNKDFIIERARKRPLNLSIINEYAKYRMFFYRELKVDGLDTKAYEPAIKRDIANPEYKPIIVFELGSLKHFIMIEDTIYRIRFFVDAKSHINQTSMAAPVEAGDGYVSFVDCVPVDPEDTFTLDRIRRCLENKL